MKENQYERLLKFSDNYGAFTSEEAVCFLFGETEDARLYEAYLNRFRKIVQRMKSNGYKVEKHYVYRVSRDENWRGGIYNKRPFLS